MVGATTTVVGRAGRSSQCGGVPAVAEVQVVVGGSSGGGGVPTAVAAVPSEVAVAIKSSFSSRVIGGRHDRERCASPALRGFEEP